MMISRNLGRRATVGATWNPGGGFFFQAEDGIRDLYGTGVQTCALPIYPAVHVAERHGPRPRTRGVGLRGGPGRDRPGAVPGDPVGRADRGGRRRQRRVDHDPADGARTRRRDTRLAVRRTRRPGVTRHAGRAGPDDHPHGGTLRRDRPGGHPSARPPSGNGVTLCRRRETATPTRQTAPPTSPYTVGISASSSHDSSTDTAGTA